MHLLTVLLLSGLMGLAFAWDLYAMDLRSLLTDKDTRNKLKDLSNKKDMPRTQMQQQLQQLLQMQPQMVQQTFQTVMRAKDQFYNQQMQQKIQQAQQMGLGQIWQQMQQIDQNLSLTRDQAEKAKKDLVKAQPDQMKKAIEQMDKNYYKDNIELTKD
ncbi:unnamed protein product, partial [Mesorhabditis belari]|uniref:Uncharacterized protein n=1 Tax=Mesorhabditis belari TaxID=2138241 RepID=A0AAF3E9U7_9BILA